MASYFNCYMSNGSSRGILYKDLPEDKLSKVASVFLNSFDLPELAKVSHKMTDLKFVEISSDTYDISLKGIVTSQSITVCRHSGTFSADNVNTNTLIFTSCCLNKFIIDSDNVVTIRTQGCSGFPKLLTGNSIKNVTICSEPIQNYDYLEAIPNLERLSLNNLTDNHEIDMRKLKIKGLCIFDSLVTSFKNIKVPDSLVQLECSTSLIDNLDDLPELPNLTSFISYKTNIKDTAFLSKMPNLIKLEIDLKYVTCLSNLPLSLVCLDISGTKVSDYVPITKLINLRELFIDRMPLNDFSFIGNMKGLMVISMEGNNLGNVEFLRDMPNLKTVYLQENNISSLEPFESCPKLEKIYVADNLIYDLEPLSKCAMLEVVNVDNNLVLFLDPLHSLDKLVSICARNNYLRDIPEELGSIKVYTTQGEPYDNTDVDNEKFSTALNKVADKILLLDAATIELEHLEQYFSEDAMDNIGCEWVVPEYENRFKPVFSRVWKLIEENDNKGIMIDILSEELESGCTDARYYKMISLIATFVEGYGIGVDKKTIIKRKIDKEIKLHTQRSKEIIIQEVLKNMH